MRERFAALSIGDGQRGAKLSDRNVPEMRYVRSPGDVEISATFRKNTAFFWIDIHPVNSLPAPIGESNFSLGADMNIAGIAEKDTEVDRWCKEKPWRGKFFDMRFLSHVAGDANKKQTSDHAGEGDLRLLVFLFRRLGTEKDDAVVTSRFGIVGYFDAKFEINDLLGEKRDFWCIKGNPTCDRESGRVLYGRGADFVFRLSVVAACGEVASRRVELNEILCGIGHLNRVRGFFAGLQGHFK